MSQNLCRLRQIIQPSGYICPLRRKKRLQWSMSQNLCPLRQKKKLSEYIESKSLPVEVKENFAIVNSKYGSLVEANHSFPNSCFETNSESISPVESIHSTLQSNSFSTFESKENFASTTLNFRLLNNVEHSSKCFGPTERRFAGYEEQLDCDI